MWPLVYGFYTCLVALVVSRPIRAENIQLDLTTLNGYQWQVSLPNGSKFFFFFGFVGGLEIEFQKEIEFGFSPILNGPIQKSEKKMRSFTKYNVDASFCMSYEI